MDESLRKELGNELEILLFQSGCTKVRFSTLNSTVPEYLVQYDDLKSLVEMTVVECSNLLKTKFDINVKETLLNHFEKDIV